MCQLRTALNALVQSWWLTPKPKRQLLEKTANIIDYQQSKNAQARKSHRKETIRKLAALGFSLSRLPQCKWWLK